MMRKYIIGCLVGFVLAFTISAHAEVIGMIGKVVQGEYDFTVNNNKLEYKAIIVDGTAYVPARLAGDASGHIVRFDEVTGVKWIKKIATPKATVINSISAINSTIATNNMMIKGNEDEIIKMKTENQTATVNSDILNIEKNIERWKKDILELNDQIAKLNQTLTDIDAQEAELSK